MSINIIKFSFNNFFFFFTILLINRFVFTQDCNPSDLIISDESITSKRTTLKTGDITWVFDKEYEIGQFANGDYWVLGPVKIMEINPPFDGDDYGWEVNPIVEGSHGFDSECKGDRFDASLVPDLPYVANPSNDAISIVKTTPTGDDYPCIKTAVVLTVVKAIPPRNGSAVFRPPYVGDEKPYYFVDNIKKELLPNYKAVDNMPSFKDIEMRFSTLQMDHKAGLLCRGLRPLDHMDNYAPGNTEDQNNAILRFMIDEPYENKKQALINFLQYGIDAIHSVYLGQRWPAGGGHQPGHQIVLSFTSTLLGIEKIRGIIDTATFFHGYKNFVMGNHGLTLFGERVSREINYWNYIMGLGGNRSQKDPYGQIDGGNISHLEYQLITSQSHKGAILATHLMPSLKSTWAKIELNLMPNYVDRWVLHGVWAQPDPYAPIDGNKDNFGKTYGMVSNQPLVAIPGKGRFPDAHGNHKDKGQYRSSFVAAMWDAYRTKCEGADTTRPFSIIINPLNSDTLYNSGSTISVTAFGIHGIKKVALFVNNKASDVTFSSSKDGVNLWTANWKNSNITGSVIISVLSTDNKGNTFKSEDVSVMVVK